MYRINISEKIILFLIAGILYLHCSISFAGEQEHPISEQKDDCCPVSHNEVKLPEEKNDVFNNLLNKKCEHEILIYQCDECRYEAGVVKADPSLWKNSKGGLLTTSEVKEHVVSKNIVLTGEVKLNDNFSVHLSPRISGVIDSVGVDFGTKVKKGDVLFTINSTEFGQALSDFERSRTMMFLSEKNFEREKKLLSQNVSSEQEMIEAQLKYEEHRASLQAAEQKLHMIGLLDEDISKLNETMNESSAGKLAIRAPIDGIIVEKHAVTGEYVEPGKDIILLADLSTLWIWANVHEDDLALLIKARERGPIPVSLTVSAYKERKFPGLIDYIGVTVDENTRMIKVRASADNSDGLLRPGMFCSVEASIGTSLKILAVPRFAVMSDEGRYFVFVRWKDDYYLQRFVETGRDSGEIIEIKKGLKTGETVLNEGSFLMKSDVLREKMGAGCAD